MRYKAACAQGLRSADHGSTSSRPRSMKDVATTSMGEGVLRSVILRYLRRRSTPTGPSRMAPERQAACGMAWIWRIGVAGSAPRLQGREITRRDDGVHFLGTLDEVLFGRQKRLDAQSANGGRLPGRDARCHGGRPRATLEKLTCKITRLGVTTTYHQSAPPEDATSETS